jgi:hypothetical protein
MEGKGYGNGLSIVIVVEDTATTPAMITVALDPTFSASTNKNPTKLYAFFPDGVIPNTAHFSRVRALP